jgi:hypothetical protein
MICARPPAARTTDHPGNIRFRDKAKARKAEYVGKSNEIINALVNELIREWKAQGGRFLKWNKNSRRWVEAPYIDVKLICRRLLTRESSDVLLSHNEAVQAAVANEAHKSKIGPGGLVATVPYAAEDSPNSCPFVDRQKRCSVGRANGTLAVGAKTSTMHPMPTAAHANVHVHAQPMEFILTPDKIGPMLATTYSDAPVDLEHGWTFPQESLSSVTHLSVDTAFLRETPVVWRDSPAAWRGTEDFPAAPTLPDVFGQKLHMDRSLLSNENDNYREADTGEVKDKDEDKDKDENENENDDDDDDDDDESMVDLDVLDMLAAGTTSDKFDPSDERYGADFRRLEIPGQAGSEGEKTGGGQHQGGGKEEPWEEVENGDTTSGTTYLVHDVDTRMYNTAAFINPNDAVTAHPSPDFSDYPHKDILQPHPHDVMSGRGGRTNSHIGNLYWRMLVQSNKELYLSLPRKQKMLLSLSIVHTIRSQNPPGRFLQKDPMINLWYDVGDQKAQEKTSQALREGAPAIRAARALNTGSPNESVSNEAPPEDGSRADLLVVRPVAPPSAPPAMPRPVSPKGPVQSIRGRKSEQTPILQNGPEGVANTVNPDDGMPEPPSGLDPFQGCSFGSLALTDAEEQLLL